MTSCSLNYVVQFWFQPCGSTCIGHMLHCFLLRFVDHMPHCHQLGCSEKQSCKLHYPSTQTRDHYSVSYPLHHRVSLAAVDRCGSPSWILWSDGSSMQLRSMQSEGEWMPVATELHRSLHPIQLLRMVATILEALVVTESDDRVVAACMYTMSSI